jgi:hypothetical protein
MSAQYAICTKIGNEILYLNRYITDKYNSSTLELPLQVYEFGQLGESTLLADKENWAAWLTPNRFEEITQFMTEYDFTNFRMAFTKIEKNVEVKYEKNICSPFYLNAADDASGHTTFKATVNWDSFC